MSALDCPQSPDVARGTVMPVSIDWGEDTAGTETGSLKAGDTVASCAVTVETKPSGASDPTFGSVAANSTALFVNGRSCSAGEATSVTMTVSGTASYGEYRLKFVATTTNGFSIPRYTRFVIREAA